MHCINDKRSERNVIITNCSGFKNKQYNNDPNLGFLWWLKPDSPPAKDDPEGKTTTDQASVSGLIVCYNAVMISSEL